MAEQQEQLWEVVGGGDQGGILVRAGEDTKSKQEDTRLSSGALVKELELKGTRLSYELVSGSGPVRGWVSTNIKGKALLTKSEKVVPKSEDAAPKNERDASLLTLAKIRASMGPAPENWWDRFWKTCDVGPNIGIADGAEPPEADAPRSGILPSIPRPNPKALPTLADLPEAIQARFRQRPITPYARLICFYGCGDSAGQWMQFLDNQPSWCEVVVYECKAHGVRQKEAWDRTYEERAEDAWENMLPMFEQHAKGGCAEGAPFAMYAHSAGICLMVLIAQRLRADLNLEPTAIYVADNRPAHWPFLNEAGHELALQDPPAMLKIWMPHIGDMWEAGGSKLVMERWTIGHELLHEWTRWCEKPRYKFDCPIFVYKSKYCLIPQDSGQFRIAYKGHTDPEECARSYKEWEEWTSKECTVTEVDATHGEIWYHFDTEQPLWRSFGGLADVHSRMPKKPKKKQ